MFYRRKILLAILQEFGKPEKIAFQKLLFLFTLKQETPSYDFIPFHYGGYSISANADLWAMSQKGMVEQAETCYRKGDKKDYSKMLKPADQTALDQIKRDFYDYSSDELMRFTYVNFGYYAINSKTAQRLLTQAELAEIEKVRPRNEKSVLYTIGYEGISLEEYLNRLIKNDVRLLVDVRSNPVSMKFGFSKKQLQTYCASVNIAYTHLPEVGIRSEYRQGLNSQQDYDILFGAYKNTTLAQTKGTQQEILRLVETNQRIALTCFEADIGKCHRTHLAKAVTELPEWKFALAHL